MSYSISELFDLRTLTNYGLDLDKEIQCEVLLSIVTNKKSVRYFNNFGTNLQYKENIHNNISNAIMLGIDIINSVQVYNENAISDKYERKVSLPFDSIEFDSENDSVGQLDIRCKYYPLKDLKEIEINTR